MVSTQEGNELKDVSANSDANTNKQQLQIKPSRLRWVILLIYILYSAVTSFQFIEYSIITNVVVKYYNVSTVAVDWTSIVYMVSYPVLVIPATFIIDKFGLRVSGLIGCLGTAVGALIKVFSIGEGLFYVVLLGQVFAACAQIFILSLPPRIATVWFKANEVSTACSVGILGATIGQAIGFIVPPLIVKNRSTIEETGNDFNILCWSVAVFMVPLSLAVIFFFPKQPEHPPNSSQIEERQNKKEVTVKEFWNSIKLLMVNKGYLIHMVSFSIYVADLTVIITLLNQFVLSFFEGAQEDAGQMGLLMITVGFVSSVLTGIMLDRTHKYKESVIFLGLMTVVSLTGFAFALKHQSKTLAYLSISVVGWFCSGYFPASLEMGVELTFPLPEGTTIGILMALSQIFSAVNTLIAGKLLYSIGAFWTLIIQVVILLVAVLLSVFVPNDLRRQRVLTETSKKDSTNL